MKVNELISNKRKELGLTLEEVANKVGVSKSTVKKWESGYIKNMRRDNMALLADALHISPMDLLNDNSSVNDTTGYYTDPETAELAEKLRTDPDMKILFSAAKDLTPEEMQQAADYVNYLKMKGRNK